MPIKHVLLNNLNLMEIFEFCDVLKAKNYC
jgi:hypothetical protein